MYLEDEDFEYSKKEMIKWISDYFLYNRININYFSDGQKKVIKYYKQKYDKLNYHPNPIERHSIDQLNTGNAMKYIYNCALECVSLI